MTYIKNQNSDTLSAAPSSSDEAINLFCPSLALLCVNCFAGFKVSLFCLVCNVDCLYIVQNTMLCLPGSDVEPGVCPHGRARHWATHHRVHTPAVARTLTHTRVNTALWDCGFSALGDCKFSALWEWGRSAQWATHLVALGQGVGPGVSALGDKHRYAGPLPGHHRPCCGTPCQHGHSRAPSTVAGVSV